MRGATTATHVGRRGHLQGCFCSPFACQRDCQRKRGGRDGSLATGPLTSCCEGGAPIVRGPVRSCEKQSPPPLVRAPGGGGIVKPDLWVAGTTAHPQWDTSTQARVAELANRGAPGGVCLSLHSDCLFGVWCFGAWDVGDISRSCPPSSKSPDSNRSRLYSSSIFTNNQSNSNQTINNQSPSH